MKFKQITCGEYSYLIKDVFGIEVVGTASGHCLYGLSEDGIIYKRTVHQGKPQWIELDKLDEAVDKSI